MLTELSIRDFAIIDAVHLEFGPGFNVLTGETGAGKSIILDAVTLIVGGRADSSLVRAGADRAIVEATFEIPAQIREQVLALLREQEFFVDDEPEPEHLVITREVRVNGRSSARLNGVTAAVGFLRELGELFVGIHGQGDHLSLLKPKSHLPLLDAYAGLEPLQHKVAAAVKELRQLEQEKRSLQADERTRQQRLDILKFQIEEIDAAQLKPDEEAELRTERTRLANTEQLAKHSTAVVALLTEMDEETPSAADLVGQAEVALQALAKLDNSQKELHERLQGVLSELQDVAAEVRSYQDDLEHDPLRLDEIEERLDVINRLKRKYGEDIGEILSLRDSAAVELENLEHSDERLAELDGLIEKRLTAVAPVMAELSARRQAAAKRLSDTIEDHLQELKMTAHFGVDFRRQPATDERMGVVLDGERLAFDGQGIDQVEFLISTNPGEPLKPLAKVASGGETARLMLALKAALAQVDATPTLIFDEIDQGIGGRIGTIVGRKLWSLTSSADHQVIVVTHLPQMAGFGDIHFQVRKHVANGRTQTSVVPLEIQERISELGAMLGTKEDLGKVSARSLLKEAAQIKQQAGALAAKK